MKWHWSLLFAGIVLYLLVLIPGVLPHSVDVAVMILSGISLLSVAIIGFDTIHVEGSLAVLMVILSHTTKRVFADACGRKCFVATIPATMKRILPFLSLIATSPAEGQWSTIEAPMQYDQVSGAGNFSKVYVAGGFDYNANYHYIVMEYDRITGLWDDDPSMFLNTGRIKVSTAIAGDRLFCAGGWVWPSQAHVSAVEIFDLAAGTLLAEAQLSQARVEIATAVAGDKVIFAGGHNAIWNGSYYDCMA